MSSIEITADECYLHAMADVVIAQSARYDEARLRVVNARAEIAAAKRKLRDLEDRLEVACKDRDDWHQRVGKSLADYASDRSAEESA